MRLAFPGALAGIALAAAVLPAQNPPDQPRRHAEVISAGRHEYTLQMGGTVDARNARDPIVYAAWAQAFDPMRSVRLENTGETDVVNPWLLVNGRRNWRSTADIVREALASYGNPAAMTDAEKARAIWEFLRRNRFHATTGDFEVRDPVKMLNVYGFSLCGDNAPALMDLWRAAGLRARRGFPIGHCVVEAWYDGGWHLLDGDESILFLDRDNRTVASEQAVARDHDLSKRAYADEYLPALYNYDGSRSGDYPSHAAHRMDFTLRPGEAIEWRSGQGEKHHYAPNPTLFTLKSANLREWGPKAWATLRNGRWTYAPPLAKPAARRGVEASGVRWTGAARGPAVVTAAGEPATLIWRMRTPYVLVGGRLTARVYSAGAGEWAFAVSHDGRDWREVSRGEREVAVSLDTHFPSPGPPHYEYFVRFQMQGAAGKLGLESISIENDLQMAPLAMPSLELGENRILYTDETAGARAVRVEIDWVERTSSQPPPPPAEPVFPAPDAAVEGTAIVFEWRPAPGAVDYHFELGDEPGLRWALSPGFDVQLSQAKSTPMNRLALPSAGLLNPGQRYYWRVRAKSAAGVWGPWSGTWSFVPHGPGTPRNLRIEEREPGAFTLAWDAAASGRKPARYRVYGSDEKGFTVSDEPREVATGNQKSRGLFPGKSKVLFDASFLAETVESFYRFAPRHAFYRVVAVDERGNRSGSSEFVEAPRPWIYTEAPREARAGTPYRYEARTVRSIGDLGYRDFGPGQSYQSAYWDADQPHFSFEAELPRCGTFDPKWLRIDPATGVLSGTPQSADAGEYQVNVRVEIQGRVHVQSFPLIVRKQ